jgi:ABC-type polar amino acid transport system ATPase subunit
LLQLLGGLDLPTSGKILIDGVELNGLNEKEGTLFRRTKVGFVFQNYQGFQRIMIVLTLITVMWSVYKLVKDGFKSKGIAVMTSISSLISVGYAVVVLGKSGG